MLIMKVCILGSLFALLAIPAGAQTISTRAGVVKKVSGYVFFHCHDGNVSVQPTVGMNLHEGDFVITGPSGSLILALNPDTYLLISPNTQVKAEKTGLDSMHFDLDRGEVFLFSKGFANRAALTLQVPPKLLEINKAGSYRIAVEEDGETQASVVRGEIRYSERTGRRVKVKAGRTVNFVKNIKEKASN